MFCQPQGLSGDALNALHITCESRADITNGTDNRNYAIQVVKPFFFFFFFLFFPLSFCFNTEKHLQQVPTLHKWLWGREAKQPRCSDPSKLETAPEEYQSSSLVSYQVAKTFNVLLCQCQCTRTTQYKLPRLSITLSQAGRYCKYICRYCM